MINTLLATLMFAQAAPAIQPPKVYRPFRYETACQLETGSNIYEDLCVVIETRETGGALRDRKSTRLNSSHVSESRMPSSA